MNRSFPYLLLMFIIVAGGLMTLEWYCRVNIEKRDRLTGYVLKVLQDPRADIAIGDSRVTHRDRLGRRVAFLGFEGLTTHEAYQVLKYRYRTGSVNRVLIEIGPQMFADNRQADWRNLPVDSFRRQIYPVTLYSLEPAFTRHLPERIALSLLGRAAWANEQVWREALIARRRLQRMGRRTAWSRLPYPIRIPLTEREISVHSPVVNVANSASWAALRTLLGFISIHGINACFAQMPYTQEYLDRAPQRFFETSVKLRAIAQKYHVPFVDQTRFEQSGNIFYFKDGLHLNGRGKRKFWPLYWQACFPPERA